MTNSVHLPENSIRRKIIERLWFRYGNHGERSTMPGHKWIQNLLVDGIDYREFYNPPRDCIEAIDKILLSQIYSRTVAQTSKRFNVNGRVIQLPKSFKGEKVIAVYQKSPHELFEVRNPVSLSLVKGWEDIGRLKDMLNGARS